MDLFKEKMSYIKAHYFYSEGIFEWLIGSFIMGYVIVNFKDKIFNYILDLINFLPEMIMNYIAYLLFGLVLLPLGIIITYVLTRIYGMLFKNNRRIIK